MRALSWLSLVVWLLVSGCATPPLPAPAPPALALAGPPPAVAPLETPGLPPRPLTVDSRDPNRHRPPVPAPAPPRETRAPQAPPRLAVQPAYPTGRRAALTLVGTPRSTVTEAAKPAPPPPEPVPAASEGDWYEEVKGLSRSELVERLAHSKPIPGDVTVLGMHAVGFSVVNLRLRNDGRKPVHVTIEPGLVLRPDGDEQNLMTDSQIRTRLEPGEVRELVLHTYCLNHERSSPGESTRFTWTTDLRPEESRALMVLRESRNPVHGGVQAGDIQAAIWGQSPQERTQAYTSFRNRERSQHLGSTWRWQEAPRSPKLNSESFYQATDRIDK